MCKVIIAVPAGDTVKTGFMYDLAALVGATTAKRPDIALHLSVLRSSILPSSRHQLVEHALEAQATHILWLDTDMRFPPDLLIALLRHEKPIVAAAYPTRRYPIHVAAEGISGNLLTADEIEKGGLIAVNWVGMGAMLVETRVFRSLTRPWFQFTYHAIGEYTGEDVWFCYAAKQGGYEIFVDADLSKRVRHIGDFEFRMEHAFLMEEVNDSVVQ